MTEHTLYLLRHAKSSWEEPLPDRERPLSVRGRRDAAATGRMLAERTWTPDLVLCSTAVRTRQTWSLAAGAGAQAGEVRYVDDIYQAGATRLASLVGRTPQATLSLMLIGHGPGLPDLAAFLGRRPDPRDSWARLDAKYPTCGLAVLRLTGPWADLTEGSAELLAFEVPRG